MNSTTFIVFLSLLMSMGSLALCAETARLQRDQRTQVAAWVVFVLALALACFLLTMGFT